MCFAALHERFDAKCRQNELYEFSPDDARVVKNVATCLSLIPSGKSGVTIFLNDQFSIIVYTCKPQNINHKYIL